MKTKNTLRGSPNKCNIDFDAVRLQMTKQEYVNKFHITQDGKPRKIKYLEEKRLYQTKLSDGTRVTARDVSTLYNKLYEYYFTGYTVENVFNLALKEKESSEVGNNQTIERYKREYKYSVAPLGKRDIRTITIQELKTYSTEFMKKKPTKKRFMAYKGVLNFIFNYGIENGVISTNPALFVKPNNYLKGCKVINKPKTFTRSEIELIQERAKAKPDIYSKAILLSIETGMRVGEICALRWEDLDFNNRFIHIHSQQLREMKDGHISYYFAEWTKDEKGISRGGRYFPMTERIIDILSEIPQDTDYVFSKTGSPINVDLYEEHLRNLCKSLGLRIWNNHAFRMSLNSRVLIAELNLPVTERAKLLGHSVETNFRYYSFAERDGLDAIRMKMDCIGHTSLTD